MWGQSAKDGSLSSEGGRTIISAQAAVQSNRGSKVVLPVVCELTPDAAKARRAQLLPGLVARAERRELIQDGYRLTFAPSSEMLRAIADTIAAERLCCRWLRFELTVPPDGGAIVLTLSGPDGARDFLAALFDA